MLPVKVTDIYSKDDTKPVNILCEQNAEFLNINADAARCDPAA
jgi:hypothetical protein